MAQLEHSHPPTVSQALGCPPISSLLILAGAPWCILGKPVTCHLLGHSDTYSLGAQLEQRPWVPPYTAWHSMGSEQMEGEKVEGED